MTDHPNHREAEGEAANPDTPTDPVSEGWGSGWPKTAFVGRGCGTITGVCTCEKGGNSECCPDDAVEVVPATTANARVQEAEGRAQRFRDYADSADREAVRRQAELDTANARARSLQEALGRIDEVLRTAGTYSEAYTQVQAVLESLTATDLGSGDG